MALDSTTIAALSTGLAMIIASVGSVIVQRRRRDDTDDQTLKTRYRKLRSYVSNWLYPATVRYHKQLIDLGQNPDPIPDEDDTP